MVDCELLSIMITKIIDYRHHQNETMGERNATATRMHNVFYGFRTDKDADNIDLLAVGKNSLLLKRIGN